MMDYKAICPLGTRLLPDGSICGVRAGFVCNGNGYENANMAVQLGMPLSDNDPDHPALMMANHLLGSGGNSRTLPS